VLLEHLETLLAEAREADGAGRGLPSYVERELRSVVSCGQPAAGFLRLRCDRCGKERLLPFACRARVACPSCATRRMESLAAHLCDRVFPAAPLRLWTVSFPFSLRRLLAADALLLSAVHRALVRLVFLSLRANAPTVRGRCGAVSFLQRFDSSLGLDLHIHLACLDGVYAHRADGTLEFHDTGTPSAADVETVAVRLAASIRRILHRRGLLTREGELAPREGDEPTPLERLYEAAARDFVTSGSLDDEGRPRLRLRASRTPQHLGPRLVEVEGVNVHADLRVEAADREGRSRLCRYGLRPAFAHEQLSFTSDRKVAFALCKRRKNGDTHRFFTPVQLLRRLAWLIPPPRQKLVRYQGALSGAAQWRSEVVPSLPLVPDSEASCTPLAEATAPASAPATDSAPGTARRGSRICWASLLRRVYDLDSLVCPAHGCGGRMRILCAITDPFVLRRILTHLGVPAELPTFARARGPPEPGHPVAD
jgi:ribosomal protein S27E